ncbi:WUSCHEL-related homeobox 11-like [Papaver somniferum]|uniref:WUSCHEL-related homeobox 11-like n=1 Tax=Papaver somniferum TaxID=3469 RepID=UPI000E6FB4E6|nr:WUSCHEL-related homeobox 11-like [Papaver somniferum]
MEDQAPDHNNRNNHPSQGSNKSEPVRSRWTPKPEQILILESIFNSGMVNPPKDETVRIRKLLEKFGAVGDANVFYWFQNRRSRSRRRQRQIQAGLLNDSSNIRASNGLSIHYEPTSSSSSSSCSSSSSTSSSSSNSSSPACFANPSFSHPFLIGSSSSSSSSCGGGGGIGDNACVDDLFSFSQQMGLSEIDQSSILCSSNTTNLHFQTGFITVFINGVPTEVPNGPLDMKSMFGQDAMLVHSSGVPVPFNEYGFSLQSLQMGESYFLVSRSL